MRTEPRSSARPIGASIFVLGLLLSADVAATNGELQIDVVGTAFRLTRADGRQVTGSELAGTILTDSEPYIRIDGVGHDPHDPTRETTLYKLAVQAADGQWENFCEPDADGVAMGFPLRGSWTETGEHIRDDSYSLTCTNGAIGKCVRLGYKPWKTTADGTSLWDYHQACTRMIRADYCGDGIAYTRPGVLIDVYDEVLNRGDPELSLEFEAAWGPDGAVFVRRARVPELGSLADIVAACPQRLEGRVGPDITEEDARNAGSALIFNRS